MPPTPVQPQQEQPPSSNAHPIEHLRYWMKVVLDNNLLEPIIQQNHAKNIPVSIPEPHVRAADVKPFVPIQAHHPYLRIPSSASAGSHPNDTQTTHDLISRAKSLLDVTNAEPLFYVGTNGKLLCRCCTSSTGFNIPQSATSVSTTNPNRRVLTDEWRNFKKSLRNHLNLSTHVTNSAVYLNQ